MLTALVGQLSGGGAELVAAAALLLGNCAVEPEQRRAVSSALAGGNGTGLAALLAMFAPGAPP